MNENDPSFSRELDWNLLKTLNEIVRAGTLTDAAFNLGRKQPSVSQALQRLESVLGVKLCRRTSRRLELTEEGEVIAEICSRMARDIEELPTRLADTISMTSAHIHLLMISNLVYPPIDAAIGAFSKQHGNTEIDVDVAPWRLIQDMILRSDGDVAIAPTRSFHEDLEYHLLFHEINRPFCGRGHPLYGRHFDSPGELAGYPFILTESDEPEELHDFRLAHGLGAHVAGRSERLEEAKRLTKLGVGICFLPDGFAAAERAEGVLWPLLPGIDEPAIPIYAMVPRDAGELCRSFLRYIMNMTRERPGAAGTRP